MRLLRGDSELCFSRRWERERCFLRFLKSESPEVELESLLLDEELLELSLLPGRSSETHLVELVLGTQNMDGVVK